MTALPAKVIALEKPGDRYQAVVQISTKYRGSFNTLAFGEIKPYSGSLKDGPAGSNLLPGSRLRGRGSVPGLDSALTGLRIVLVLVVLEKLERVASANFR